MSSDEAMAAGRNASAISSPNVCSDTAQAGRTPPAKLVAQLTIVATSAASPALKSSARMRPSAFSETRRIACR